MLFAASTGFNGCFGSSDPKRFIEGSFDAPSAKDSHFKSFWIESDSFGPFGDALSFSIPLYEAIESGVSILLRSGLPSAIFGFVIPVVVDSANAMESGRSRSHISDEGLERISPVVADGNSATAISAEVVVAPSDASSDHVSPTPITGLSFESVRVQGLVHGNSITTF